jgi:uncharacterized protein YecA (UPF0149 family)
MKKLIGFGLSVLIVLSFMSAFVFAGKYDEVAEVMTTYGNVMMDFANETEKATNADEIAAAMNKFGDGMEKLLPDLLNVMKKYPEIKNTQNPPEELKPLFEKIENEVMKKFMAGMMKIAEYSDAEPVQKAQEKLQKIMVKFQALDEEPEGESPEQK